MKSPTCLYTNAVNFSLVSVVQVMDDVIELGRWYVHGMHLVFSKSENASVVFFANSTVQISTPKSGQWKL